jgi:hypothetical protein
MNGSRGKVVILGMMTKMPVAGVVWQNVHYLKGFELLGFEPYYVEAHARTPTPLMTDDRSDGSAAAASFIDGVMRRYGLGRDRWAFHALHSDGAIHGMSRRRLGELYRDASLIINLHGGTVPLDEHAASGRLIYLETDPGQLQVELGRGDEEAIRFLAPHVAFFTFAENYGQPDCSLPHSSDFYFRPTRQPVVIDYWKSASVQRRPIFTTVGNWRQRWRDVEHRDEIFHWSKDREFMKVLDLPSKVGRRFELAMSSINERDRELLRAHGWHVVDAFAVSKDPGHYSRYVHSSFGEFTVAKDQNVRMRTGWFSDRSATYLAAGRPVITQDTGFGTHLPTGNGLFSFTSVDDAAEAVRAVLAEPNRHSSGAREVARAYFSAETVLRDLVTAVGV